MATTVTYTIDPGGTGDYTSISAAIADLTPMNLVSLDQELVLLCISSTGAILEDNVTVSGFTTDSTHKLFIKADTGHRAGPVWNDSIFRIGASSGIVFSLSNQYVVIDGIQIDMSILTGSSSGNVSANQSWIVVRNCHMVGGTIGIQANNFSYICLYNNIIRECAYQAINFPYYNLTNKLYNNLAYNCNLSDSTGDGSIKSYVATAKNNISVINSPYTDYSGSYLSYNISSDSSSTGTGAIPNCTPTDIQEPGTGTWVIFTDLTEDSEDFSLGEDVENEAIGNGIGPSADSDVPATDMLGNERSGATTDIGPLIYIEPDIEGDFSDTGGPGDSAVAVKVLSSSASEQAESTDTDSRVMEADRTVQSETGVSESVIELISVLVVLGGNVSADETVTETAEIEAEASDQGEVEEYVTVIVQFLTEIQDETTTGDTVNNTVQFNVGSADETGAVDLAVSSADILEQVNETGETEDLSEGGETSVYSVQVSDSASSTDESSNKTIIYCYSEDGIETSELSVAVRIAAAIIEEIMGISETRKPNILLETETAEYATIDEILSSIVEYIVEGNDVTKIYDVCSAYGEVIAYGVVVLSFVSNIGPKIEFEPTGIGEVEFGSIVPMVEFSNR